MTDTLRQLAEAARDNPTKEFPAMTVASDEMNELLHYVRYYGYETILALLDELEAVKTERDGLRDAVQDFIDAWDNDGRDPSEVNYEAAVRNARKLLPPQDSKEDSDV